LVSEALKSYSKVLVIPNIGDTPSIWVAPRDLSGKLGLEIHQHLFNPFSTLLKRSTDLFLVCTTIPLWAPLCGLLAGMIWLQDRHAPVYRQERVGRAGKRFNTLKFRTMVPDAESVLQDHLESDSTLRAEWETHFKLLKDPRITPVGNFLRKTSLDELPQLLNVLRGDMSLVGPRPLPFYHYEQLPVAVREQRERMRPGITGLWQVSGRSDSGNAGMIRWDPYYVMNWSIWLDLVILVRTVRVVLLGSGAR
jgi:Undecaprenyl-phosphate galactose phosphotransferase WbaP